MFDLRLNDIICHAEFEINWFKKCLAMIGGSCAPLKMWGEKNNPRKGVYNLLEVISNEPNK